MARGGRMTALPPGVEYLLGHEPDYQVRQLTGCGWLGSPGAASLQKCKKKKLDASEKCKSFLVQFFSLTEVLEEAIVTTRVLRVRRRTATQNPVPGPPVTRSRGPYQPQLTPDHQTRGQFFFLTFL